jgi:hypothetical protein
MMNQFQEKQRIIRRYKDETGEKEVDMHKIAIYARDMGYPLPKLVSQLDLLARQFSQAAREEVRVDRSTGHPYRVNHAYTKQADDGKQMTLWIDIDEAPRFPMHKSLITRREQMLGDGVQLTLDADHWNSIHPAEEPIAIPMDFTDDVEWRKNAPLPRFFQRASAAILAISDRWSGVSFFALAVPPRSPPTRPAVARLLSSGSDASPVDRSTISLAN